MKALVLIIIIAVCVIILIHEGKPEQKCSQNRANFAAETTATAAPMRSIVDVMYEQRRVGECARRELKEKRIAEKKALKEKRGY